MGGDMHSNQTVIKSKPVNHNRKLLCFFNRNLLVLCSNKTPTSLGYPERKSQTKIGTLSTLTIVNILMHDYAFISGLCYDYAFEYYFLATL